MVRRMTTVGLGVGKRTGWFVNTISTDIVAYVRQSSGKIVIPTDRRPKVSTWLKHLRAVTLAFLHETWKYMHLLAQTGWLKQGKFKY